MQADGLKLLNVVLKLKGGIFSKVGSPPLISRAIYGLRGPRGVPGCPVACFPVPVLD
jgi:hypothetical protein